ncbi:uncharacterized protein LOC100259487 isoform X1 [Vitis vinifera]|uniref:uncharacterized protein LOC100259487 isoform X1 n=1 Tax=Vitis vinifera TaxID=29760 RepID=UPI00053F3617|nr:uncharacterized protein LOC100259487 isoform X1 [Vitis vinifera]|eukprot:XP_010659955.1 PREDICTED: uncharacterized protein LOC100259487 isoform X1 [Vitis vinifera]
MILISLFLNWVSFMLSDCINSFSVWISGEGEGIAAIESRNRLMQASVSAIADTKVDCKSHKMDFKHGSSPRKLVECRICQDEDEDSNMETPCSCCGSLKYAHRSCVQRWCNEKGNTMCEICQQQFKPGYTAPPPLFQFRGIPINLRGNWEISRGELNNPRFIAMVSTDRNFLDPDYNEFTTSTSRSMMCCRSVAIIFMVLLILRHTLPVMINGAEEYTFPLFMLVLLRTAGIILPIYIMLRAVTAIQRRPRQQDPPTPYASTDEETEQPALQPQTHIIHVP